MVVPRAVSGLNESTGWSPATPRGVRQLAEVVLDEIVLSGFSLLGATLPTMMNPLDGYAVAAEEISALGIDGAHADPNPLLVRSICQRRIAGIGYQRMTFEHDPELPAALAMHGLGGPAKAVVHLYTHRDGPRPWLVWVHGAGQGGPEDLLLSRIDRVHRGLGFNIAMPVQPGHGSRRRQWPRYPDMDPLSNVAGMMRAVSEVRAVVRYARPHATAVVVAGISMGSPVAALVSHLEREVDAVALYTPILGLNSMIARHLARRGDSAARFRERLESPATARLTSVIDPLAVDPAPPPHRRLIVGAWHDRMAMREPAIELQQRWRGQLHWYDGGHVGQLFSRRVQRISEGFLRGVAESAGSQ
ncbi:Alpha/beta hydrolase family protein [Mycobacterium basiliense]|uniref:Alpha/beta hydrolase family protein n=2 Tax=Mycobacterium basiliense TaxID=2094119 RepID=A0A447GHN6_9MYCO|nr:Alpha/beta hydrolase family protein [Mycobacterium basiliense]